MIKLKLNFNGLITLYAKAICNCFINFMVKKCTDIALSQQKGFNSLLLINLKKNCIFLLFGL